MGRVRVGGEIYVHMADRVLGGADGAAATDSGFSLHLGYDLQQLGRAAVVGERTRGGVHAREAFPVHAHLQATIPLTESVNPITGGNWEGTEVTPDIDSTASQARDTAYRLALQAVIAAGTPPQPRRAAHSPQHNPPRKTQVTAALLRQPDAARRAPELCRQSPGSVALSVVTGCPALPP